MLRKFGIQVSAQAALAAASFSVPLIAVQVFHASYFEVGLIVAAYGLAQFVSSTVFGRAADVHGRRRLVRAGLGLSTLAVLANAFARDPAELAIARGLFGFAAGVFPAALTSLAYDDNRRLGLFQSFGSLGVSVGVLAGGALALRDPLNVFYLASLLLALAFAVSLSLHKGRDAHVEVPIFPREVIARNLPAYLAVILRHAGSAAVWAVLPIYLLSLGADVFFVGLVSFANGVFQFFLMPLMDRYASRPLLVAGLGASALAFALLYVLTQPWQILLAMSVLAGSWAALYIGALKFVMERNEARSTSTGLLQSSVQISAVVGPLLGGAVATIWGLRATMLLALALALVAIPVFIFQAAHDARASTKARAPSLLAEPRV